MGSDTMNKQAAGGYRPLSLTLKGFRGIRSGLGRDELTLDLDALVGSAELVAITGSNGRGKTTVMDNLHPYMTMPSRAGANGLGAFSFYDHVYLPQSEKELVWRHDERTFRTHLVFRVNGKKQTEAFLFERLAGRWQPARLADGTVSDGKVATYERLVTHILCAQETFFASVFSPQGKRPLSAYANAEVKALLGDLLGLEQVRELGARAGEVVKDLRTGLLLLRRQAAQAHDRVKALDETLAKLGDVGEEATVAGSARVAADAALAAAQQAFAQAAAQQEAAATYDGRRRALAQDRARFVAERDAALQRLRDEVSRLDEREKALRQRAETRVGQHETRRRALAEQQERLHAVLRLGPSIARAQQRQPAAAAIAARWGQRRDEAQRQVDAVGRLQARREQARQAIGATEREAGQVVLRHADLERRFGLSAAVPCAGLEMAGRCQLLGDAREAQALLPSATAQLKRLAQVKSGHQAALSAIEQELVALSDAATVRNRAEARLELAQARAQALQLLAARAGEMDQAATALATVDAELRTLPEQAQNRTADEQAEQVEIDGARQRAASERERTETAARDAIARVDVEAAQLPAPFDAARIESARASLGRAQLAVAAADAGERAALRRIEEHKAAVASRHGDARQHEAAETRSRRVEAELSSWTLLAKCLSNDGIVALDIDDAGPTFSALANDLLLACYGPRFTLEVITQTQTAKGELREDFDILVHDGWRDESKSLKLVSGGERVWINECLTRAIAIYLADNTNRRLATLFCDEADGPLDPEHKRMFMAMKREVLRLGGYATEYFVSQTPELTAMADRTIDLDAMVAVAAAEQ
jgi:exonuclease SbcC